MYSVFLIFLQNLLPSDDSLPDRVAESLHNLSHAYHALSDLTFNFRSPEPRRLSVLPSLSNHVGASPFISSLFSGGHPTPPTTQSGQQVQCITVRIREPQQLKFIQEYTLVQSEAALVALWLEPIKMMSVIGQITKEHS